MKLPLSSCSRLPTLLLLLQLLCHPGSLLAEVRPNFTEYNRTCGTVDNQPISRVCSGVPNETLRLFGEDFGVHYVRGKTKSRVFVGLILTKCRPGEYCVHLAQAEPSELEDRLLISWKDQRVRNNLCRLWPCLSRLPECGGNRERQLTLQAIGLVCSLTELQGAGVGGYFETVPYCLEGGLDLLQYAYADFGRPAGDSVRRVCDCQGQRIGCPEKCRQFIYKLNCLFSQCLPHERNQIVSFPVWRWYFSQAEALKAKYNVTFCERPIETSAAVGENRGPVVLAFFPNMGNAVMAIVLVVVIAALLMVGVTCVCWQRIFLNRYSRDRVGYTEVKGTL